MPKTSEQEALEGYPGHRPKNGSAPVPDREIPPPPKWMGNISSRAYHDLVRVVGPEGMRVMAKSDRLALVLVCEAFEEWRRCRDLLDKAGRYFESGKAIVDEDGNLVAISNKQIKRHPAVGDMQDAWRRIMIGLGKFGLTPYDRSKVSAIVDDTPKESREDKIAKRRAAIVAMAKEKAVNE